MKICFITVNYKKDNVREFDLLKAMNSVSDNAYVAVEFVADVSEYVLGIADFEVTAGHIYEAFEKADLYVVDQVWEGRDWPDILNQMEHYQVRRVDEEAGEDLEIPEEGRGT